MIFTLSNCLSLLRAPLAFLFLLHSPFYRCLAIVLAMITDWFDGHLARKWKKTSQLGAFLDPLMDKFFVIFAASVFISEGKLQIWEALALISRDFAVLLFAGYLAVSKRWSNFQLRSIWCGKITTTLQFFVLLGFTFNLAIPLHIFWCFIVLGILALGELYIIDQRNSLQSAIEQANHRFCDNLVDKKEH